MKKITIVRYGAGNILSLTRALDHIGCDVHLTENPKDILKADRLLLPGVGAFGHCIDHIKSRGFLNPLLEYAQKNRPFLGVCVGMQMLCEASEEFGFHEGLGLIPGNVVKIPTVNNDGIKQKVPHIGWASLKHRSLTASPLFKNIDDHECFYFVHSYHANTAHELRSSYPFGGHDITAFVQKDNIVGCQFHPEKSGRIGLKLLENFLMI